MFVRRVRLLSGHILLLLMLAGLLALSPLPVHAQAPEIASYEMHVGLDPASKTLNGTEKITFRNSTSRPTQDLYLHLYPNAFRGPESTFMRESPGAARRAAAENNWGGMGVTALRLASGEDLLPGSSVDDTVMRVSLPRPLEPGQSIQLDAAFSVELVEVIARSGYYGDHFMIAQWFPKMAVLTENGWNAHQYHANSEFFADFGSYRVEITLPERFVVGATGTQMGETRNTDGTRTLVYEAQNVHDFAWTANPEFREARAKAGQTEVRLLYQPAHEDRRDRFLGAAVAAVENFGAWFGPYPYPLLTVVDSPAEGGSGMEYPTLVTVGGLDPAIPGLLIEEQVTIHEVGHQWWYGMAASNEFEEAWLDEGFTEYSTRKLADQLYGPDRSLGAFLGFPISQIAYDRGTYLSVKGLDPTVQDAWSFHDGASYQGNVYGKASLILGTLERYLGGEKMGQLMRTYFQRFAFRHPTTQDFLQVVKETSGEGLDRFLQQALYSPAGFDYAAEAPQVRREGQQFISRIEVRRLGEGTIPVDVITTFEDGSRQSEVWDGEAGWQRYEYARSSPAVKVEVDPEHKLLLDSRWANNSRTTWFSADPVLKRAADFLWLMQGWLKLLGYGL